MAKPLAAIAQIKMSIWRLGLLIIAPVALAGPLQTEVSQAQLLQFFAANTTFTLVDARSAEECSVSHIAGAIRVPHDAERGSSTGPPLDRDAPIVVYCKTGRRAALLRQKLQADGYTDVRVLQPEQIVWFEGSAVFNCGVDAADRPATPFDRSIIEGKRE